VKGLIFEGADLNNCSGFENCSSALTLAVEHRNIELVKKLFEAGADVNHLNTRSIRGRTPSAAAAKIGDNGIIRLLFDNGADPNDPCAFENAASRQIVDLPVKRHRELYPHSSKGFGAALLKKAVLVCDESYISKLLALGMDPTAFIWEESQDTCPTPFEKKRRQGARPIGHAISKVQPNRNSIVNLLLKREFM
jgi:hypothetical protein